MHQPHFCCLFIRSYCLFVFLFLVCYVIAPRSGRFCLMPTEVQDLLCVHACLLLTGYMQGSETSVTALLCRSHYQVWHASDSRLGCSHTLTGLFYIFTGLFHAFKGLVHTLTGLFHTPTGLFNTLKAQGCPTPTGPFPHPHRAVPGSNVPAPS